MIEGVLKDAGIVPVIDTIALIMITEIVEIAEIVICLTAPSLMLILRDRCRHHPMLAAITSIDQLHHLLVPVLIHPRDCPWMNALKESMVSK